MSGLAFLTQAEAPAEAIVARTPMERRARAAGASFERRAGWNVAVSYAAGAEAERERLTETVAFTDRSQLCKLELQAAPGPLETIVCDASGGDAVLMPGRAVRTSDTWWCAVTPSRALVLAESEDGVGASVLNAVYDAAGRVGGLVSVIDMTSALAAMTLAGPGANELLARFCAIDVRPGATPVGGFRPGSVARTPGYLLRETEDRLLVLVGWALGEYLWEVVADAAEHLGGGPVGTDALGAAVEGAHA